MSLHGGLRVAQTAGAELVADHEDIKFYSIDDHILLRRGKLGQLIEQYTRDGWKVWQDIERFDTQAEELDEEQARELLEQVKKRFAEIDGGVSEDEDS